MLEKIRIFSNRFVVKLNPWTVMRTLGEQFGYSLWFGPTMSMVKIVEGRVLCIWNMERRISVTYGKKSQNENIDSTDQVEPSSGRIFSIDKPDKP